MANVKATDLIDFTRASAGHALRKVSYGDELVTNSTFDSDTSNWVANGGASQTVLSIDSQRLKVTTVSTTANAYASQELTLTAGKVYRITGNTTAGTYQHGVAVGLTAGAVNVAWTGYQSVDQNVDMVFVATQAENHISLYARTSSGGEYAFFDNISVKEVTFDQPDGSLQLFEHPNNIPRIEYDASGNVLGLLIEEARTNLITYSEDFSNSAWAKFPAATVTPSLVTTPDGQQNGFLLEATGTNRLEETPSTTITGTATFSVFAKYDDVPYVQMTILDSSANGQRQWFKIQDGTLGSSATVGTGKNLDGASITDMNNGFYRLSLSVDGFSSQTARCLIYLARTDSSFDAASGDSAVVYGAQLEAGYFPTSYIKTSGSTASRSADVASIDVNQFGYNQSEGTIFIESQTFDSTNAGRNFSLNDGTSSNLIRSQTQTSNHLIVINSGSVTANLDAGTYSNNVFSKLAGAFKQNDIAASMDGGAVVTDTSSNIPTVTKLNIGGRYDGGLLLNGHIKSLTYTPKRLSNAKLQELTS